MKSISSTAVCLWIGIIVGGCSGGCRGPACDEPAPAPEKSTDRQAPVPEPEPASEAPPQPVELPGPAASAMDGKCRVKKSLKLEQMSDIESYALRGSPALPGWGLETGQPELARDDDLLTAWTCTPSDDGDPCALGLAFPEPAEVSLLRIFAASGTSKKDYLAHGRARLLRIHTDAGWVEAELPDGWNFRHVFLPEPVSTRSLVVEIRSVYGGKHDTTVLVSELEVFGPQGEKREPLALDVDRIIVRFDRVAWVGIADTTPCWIEEADGKGNSRRILRGTSFLGRAAGHFWLVERLHDVGCEDNYTFFNGGYTLVHRASRLFYDFDLWNGAIDFARLHPDGRGIAFSADVRQTTDGSRVAALLFEDGGYSWEKDKFRDEDTDESWSKSQDMLRSHGFLEKKSDGEKKVEKQPLVKCAQIGDDEAMALLGKMKGKQWKQFRDSIEAGMDEYMDSDASWSRCTWGSDITALHHDCYCMCNEQDLLVTLDESNGIVDAHYGYQVGRPRKFAGRLVVLTSTDAGGYDILELAPGGKLEKLYAHAAFGLDMPVGCDCSM